MALLLWLPFILAQVIWGFSAEERRLDVPVTTLYIQSYTSPRHKPLHSELNRSHHVPSHSELYLPRHNPSTFRTTHTPSPPLTFRTTHTPYIQNYTGFIKNVKIQNWTLPVMTPHIQNYTLLCHDLSHSELYLLPSEPLIFSTLIHPATTPLAQVSGSGLWLRSLPVSAAHLQIAPHCFSQVQHIECINNIYVQCGNIIIVIMIVIIIVIIIVFVFQISPYWIIIIVVIVINPPKKLHWRVFISHESNLFLYEQWHLLMMIVM